uniref:LemA family protein n=1 Tax=uncultured bacterium pAW1 TaxID=1781155 RepID=A0A1C9U4Q6_9BACT|nr:LemA family protein [uncultured bacterium pAW1]
MKVVGIVLGALVVLAIVIGLYIWGGRGELISRSQGVDAQWSQVQNVYQRRFDLVPNLVAAVDNFMERQQATLTEVIAMRQRVLNVQGEAEQALKSGSPQLLDSLSGALSRQMNSLINVVVEQYPQIKGDQLFSDLQVQLEGTENRIAQERRVYNEVVRDYNVYRQRGVRALIAGSVFGFPYEKEYFAASTEAQTAPSVRDAFNQGQGSGQ